MALQAPVVILSIAISASPSVLQNAARLALHTASIFAPAMGKENRFFCQHLGVFPHSRLSEVIAHAANIQSVYPNRGSTEGANGCTNMHQPLAGRMQHCSHAPAMHQPCSCQGGTFLVISGSGFMMPVEARFRDSEIRPFFTDFS